MYYRKTKSKFYDVTKGANGKYLPAFPLIWNPSPEIENNFAKHYNVLVTHYADKYGWLGLAEIGFYNLLQTYAHYGQAIIVDDFAKKYQISPNTLTKIIDLLQNCELIYRVCRVDHRGHPNDLVLQPPQPPSKLEGGYCDKLNDNVQIDKIRILRKDNKEKYLLKSAFSEKQITRALGYQARFADALHEKCLQESYYFFTQKPKEEILSKEHRDYVYTQVFGWCNRKNIEYTQDVQDAVYSILQHYSIKPFRFH